MTEAVDNLRNIRKYNKENLVWSCLFVVYIEKTRMITTKKCIDGEIDRRDVTYKTMEWQKHVKSRNGTRTNDLSFPGSPSSGGALASWLVRSTPDRVVQVHALAGDIVLHSWTRHFILTVPLSTQVYKWAPANLMLGVILRWTSIPPRGGGGE